MAARDGLNKLAVNVQRGLDGFVDDLIDETRSHLEIAISQLEPHTGYKHPIREIADALESHQADVRMLDRSLVEGPPRTPGWRPAVEEPALEAVRETLQKAVAANLQAAHAALALAKPDAKQSLSLLWAASNGIDKVAARVQSGRHGMVDSLIFEIRSDLELSSSRLEPYAGSKHPISEISRALDNHLMDLRMLDRRLSEGLPVESSAPPVEAPALPSESPVPSKTRSSDKKVKQVRELL
jgi:hypothetical protein